MPPLPVKRVRPLFLCLALGSIPYAIFAQDADKKDEVDLKKTPWKEPLPEGLFVKPYLQNVTRQSMVILWETKSPVLGYVDYGADRSFGKTVAEPTPATIHEIALDGLSPGTQYHYRVRFGGTALEPSTFKTAPPAGVLDCRVAVYGDARTDPRTHRKNIEQMARFNPDLILHTGDIVASGKTYDQWQQMHFWPTQILTDRVVIFPALGNHEENAANHFSYMSLPGNEVFFSFDYAGVHFIALDSNAGWTPYGKGSPQYEWLVQDLEANRSASWRVAYFHHPLFRGHPTRGIEAQRYDWHPVFEKYGVDMVISGHDHYYFRCRPIGKLGLRPSRGVFYLTTGGGGAPLYPVRERIYSAAGKTIHHTVQLEFSADRIEGRALDEDGVQFDAFTVTRAPTPSGDFISYEIFELERELRNKVNELKPAAVQKAGDRVAIDATISFPTTFSIRVEGDLVWEKSDKWKVSAAKTPFVLNPGATLSIPIKAEATFPDLYPLPKLSINFTRLVNRSEGFRNHEVSFQPIKIKPLLPVSIPRVYTEVAVDGRLTDPVWAAAVRLNDYINMQGDARPAQKLSTLLAHDGKFLYAAAAIDADVRIAGGAFFKTGVKVQGDLDDGLLSADLRGVFKENKIDLSQDVDVSIKKKGQYWQLYDRGGNLRTYGLRKAGDQIEVSYDEGSPDRDSASILDSEERFAIALSDGTNVYVFAVNSQGTQYDANKGERGWNLDWRSRVVTLESGWAVEMAIPIAAFGKALVEKEWRIGISRGDKLKSEFAALCPSLTPIGLDNRIPEYSYAPTDAASLSPAVFENIKP